jgi:hypothetical protein
MRNATVLLLIGVLLGALCSLRAEAASRGSFVLGTQEATSALNFDPFVRSGPSEKGGGRDISGTKMSDSPIQAAVWPRRPPIRPPFRPPIRSAFRPPL